MIYIKQTGIVLFVLAVVTLFSLNSCKDDHTVRDIEGNVYAVIKIGNQVWMAQNLRVTRYRNGDPILSVTGNKEWSEVREGASCSYNNNDGHAGNYGRLYNWYAVQDSRNIAPEGWHVPTTADIEILINHLNGDTTAGGQMKTAGISYWLYPNTGGTNASGFSALPGGYRYGHDGTFHTLGSNGYWWNTTGSFELFAWSKRFYNSFADVKRDAQYFTYGFSIRCIKDE